MNLDTIEQADDALRMKVRARLNRRNAAKVLRSIESATGPVPRHVRAQADDYAGDVLGSRSHAAWLYVYCAIGGEFREGWIPDDYYMSVVLPAIEGRHGALSDMRAMTARIFGHEKEIPDSGYVVKGRLFSASLDESASLEEFTDLVFAGGDRVAFKADGSARGRGVQILDRESFTRTAGDLPDGVVQPFIHQHEAFAEIASGSVGTLRMTTVVEPDGQTSLRDAYLRFGRETEDHVASDSNIRVLLDTATGAFSPIGYTVDWLEIDRHPDSGAVFAGREVPNYAACREAVERLHRRFPVAPVIGWDLTVSQDGSVHVLEWNNGHNDIKFSEATSGPCFTGLGWEHLGRKGGRPGVPH
ncbi:sugar-transfer associated ATP-grasp domain-containing protein [Nesterenkonia sp. K-15-9-6]|uniref:sugar-transfer associated ATP-grasp domain-containing protein n=1 Tax=Nesterenkonia sp. K-15-9-6 TaxID=3093918 RepID=UPI0040447821